MSAHGNLSAQREISAGKTNGGTVNVPPNTVNARSIIVLSAGLGAVMPLATDIYVMMLPSIARDFGATLGAMQATMAAFALGFGVAHLFIGVAADRFGRRPVLIAALLLFLLASAAVMFAPSFEMLTATRLLQGVAAAACPILSRAIVRDALPPVELSRAYASTSALTGLAPLIAPFLAAWAAGWGGWRAALAILLAYGVVLALAVIARLPETRPQIVHAASPFAVAGELLHHPSFLVGSAAATLIYAALFTWLTTSPFLLMDRMGFSTTAAAFVYGSGAGFYVVTNLVTARLASRVEPHRLLLLGAVAMLAGAMLTWFAVTRAGLGPAQLIAAMMPFYVGLGLAHPNALQTVMRPFAHVAGQASAWLGLIQQLGGIVISTIAVWLGAGAMAAAVMTACCAALLLVALAMERRSAGR